MLQSTGGLTSKCYSQRGGGGGGGGDQLLNLAFLLQSDEANHNCEQTNHSAAMRYSQLQLLNSIGTLERCYLAIFVCAFNEPISFDEKLSRLKRYVRMPSGAKLRPIA